MNSVKNYEELALSYIPLKIREAIRRTMGLYKGNISEIRLRAKSPVFITVNNNNISCKVNSSYEDIDQIVRALCGNSMYSHSETIKEGYICTEGGLRTGICGRAVLEGDHIITICDISSVCIRIPHRVKGFADKLINKLISDPGGVLIYSKPGAGKTTMLREIAAALSSPPFNLRISVIDTRFEICGALNGEYTIDALSGYPRDKGIEMALRTLSPQFIICDEIANIGDAKAIINSAGSGVPVIASAHAGSFEELKCNNSISQLLDLGIFKHIVGLEKTDYTSVIVDSYA